MARRSYRKARSTSLKKGGGRNNKKKNTRRRAQRSSRVRQHRLRNVLKAKGGVCDLKLIAPDTFQTLSNTAIKKIDDDYDSRNCVRTSKAIGENGMNYCISFKFQNEIQKKRRSCLAKDEKQKLIGPIFCGIVCEGRGDTKEPPKKTETDAFMMRVDDKRGYHGGGYHGGSHGLDDDVDGDDYEVDVDGTGISSIVQNQIITMSLSMKEEIPCLRFYTNGTKIGEHNLNGFKKSENWYWGCTIIAIDTELAIVDTPDADSKVAKLFSEEVSPSQETLSQKIRGGGF